MEENNAQELQVPESGAEVDTLETNPDIPPDGSTTNNSPNQENVNESGNNEGPEPEKVEAPNGEAADAEDADAETADTEAAEQELQLTTEEKELENTGIDKNTKSEEASESSQADRENDNTDMTENKLPEGVDNPPQNTIPEEELPLPVSEDFTTGEKPEGSLEISADVLPAQDEVEPTDVQEISEGDIVRPSTPEKDNDEKSVLFEEDIQPQFSREELVQKYHAALSERESLNQKNQALEHKLAEYFRRKKTEDSRQEVDRNVTDQEQRFMKYMGNLEELQQQEKIERESYNEQIEEMKQRKADKQALVEEEWNDYCRFKKSVALSSVFSSGGRLLTLDKFEEHETKEMNKESEVSVVRLENIKLRNRLRKREMQLKQKEELAEGLHLIDFEQLKIENQTYNEKIEERNEELMKLRKKIRDTVQVLTHLKEKLQFVHGENQVARQELWHVESEVAKQRDILSHTKQARDALRHNNSKLRQTCGLLGNKLLLRDYEEGTDDITELSHCLDQLRRNHAELTLRISGVKKKIELAKAHQSIA